MNVLKDAHPRSDEYLSRWKGPMLYDSINVYSEALNKMAGFIRQ